MDMKKILFFIICTFAFVSSYADVVSLNHANIIGKWNVVESSGDNVPYYYFFDGWTAPQIITFNNGRVKPIEIDYGYSKEYIDFVFIGASSIDEKPTLHFILDDGTHRQVNYKISHYDGNKMILHSYDDSMYMVLERDISDGIKSMKTESTDSTQVYSIDGKKLNSPQKGINIIRGKKILVE